MEVPGKLRPALFLDRDGVINRDDGYVHRVKDFCFVDGIFEIAKQANHAELPIIVVTNQSGIGRGYYNEERFHELTTWMCRRFSEAGAPISAVYHCPYHAASTIPDYAIANHAWRKPNPGMLLAAATEHNISLKRSLMIGDRGSDFRAAAHAGLAMCCLVGEQDSALHDPGCRTRLVQAPSVAALAAKFEDLLGDL